MLFQDAVRARTSANNFDASASISSETIENLVALASEAPSSFNIQHTRFVAVVDPEVKGALKAAAWGQAKVSDAAVVFLVLADVRAHEDFIVRTRAAAAAGQLPEAVAEQMCGMAGNFYANPAAAREEGIRSAGLSAMTLMRAATDLGYASCPMIGFDPVGVAKVLGLTERYVPAMMVVVGPAAPGNWPRKARLPVSELLRMNKGDF